MHRVQVLNALLAAVTSVTIAILWSLRVDDIDSYIALLSLEYLVIHLAAPPSRLELASRIIAILVFIAAVVHRVLEVR